MQRSLHVLAFDHHIHQFRLFRAGEFSPYRDVWRALPGAQNKRRPAFTERPLYLNQAVSLEKVNSFALRPARATSGDDFGLAGSMRLLSLGGYCRRPPVLSSGPCWRHVPFYIVGNCPSSLVLSILVMAGIPEPASIAADRL